MRHIKLTLSLYTVMFTVSAVYGGEIDYKPEIHGTIRAKYEYEPPIGKGRFEVRNARVGIEGKVLKELGYKAEIDLCDEGEIKMLDAYVRYTPGTHWRLQLGQMRAPFTIDAHRAPHTQFFANRSFIAKQAGNLRDVGLTGSYTWSWLTVDGGIFNGSGLKNQKDYWTKSYIYSGKITAKIAGKWTLCGSAQRIKPAQRSIFLWDVGGFYDNSIWHVEGEYIHKSYSRHAYKAVSAFDIFGVRRFKINKSRLNTISALMRYDYMDDHSNGKPDENGQLVTDDPQRHRLTAGTTLSFGVKKLQADLRLNYEQYFYRSGVTPDVSEQNKIVAEVVVHF